MRKILTFIIPTIILFACETQQDVDFNYDFSITKYYSSNDYLVDSSIYFYNSNKRLLKIEDNYRSGRSSNDLVFYRDTYIIVGGIYYNLDSNGRIISVSTIGEEMIYDNDLIIGKRTINNNNLIQEIFYKYENGKHVTDSTVNYDLESDNKLITVSNFNYTDTLKPDFAITETGLYNYPSKSDYLVRDIHQKFYQNEKLQPNGYLVKCNYNISMNELVETAYCYDSRDLENPHETNRTTYLQIKK